LYHALCGAIDELIPFAIGIEKQSLVSKNLAYRRGDDRRVMAPEGTSSTWEFRTLTPEQTVSDQIFIIFVSAVFVIITVKLVRFWRAALQANAGDGQQKRMTQQLIHST